MGSIDLTLPFVKSKKERRAVLNHVLDKLKKSNISTMDSSGEYPHEAILMFSFVRADEDSIKRTIEKIEDMLFEVLSDDNFEINYELI
jgi:uncharacterized protein YlxP (DUF503 family)